MPDAQPPEPTRRPPPAASAPIVADDAAMSRVLAHLAAVAARLARLLESHPCSGDVRALVLDAVSRGGGELPLEPFLQAIAEHRPEQRAAADAVAFPSTLPTLRGVQELLVDEALRRSRGNQAMAASWLGITRQGLNKRLRGRAPRAPGLLGASPGASAPPPVA
jgi:DNA-binding NtrC family response regulator